MYVWQLTLQILSDYERCLPFLLFLPFPKLGEGVACGFPPKIETVFAHFLS
jgi:hypothetical protein